MLILIVDDSDINLKLLAGLTESAVGVVPTCFDCPVEALTWCANQMPDLLVVDYMMPNLSGLDFIGLFRQMDGCANVPIIMVTTENERSIRADALALGATDFVAKPLDAIEFRSRVRNLTALRQAQNLLADRARLLQNEVEAATAVIRARERELVIRLARASELRDPETGAHIVRMAHYSKLIAGQLGMPASYQQAMLEAAPMHDIGKLGTPDHILLKPGRLDPDEMAIMRLHAATGAAILADSDSPLLQLAGQIAGAHHEKFDGSGYPLGLRGDDIPLAGRIVAVADVFDALTSVRPYKRAWTMDAARQFIVDHTGTHFCPACASAFDACWEQVLDIRARFDDVPA